MKTYRAAVVGCSRMGAFIDNEVVGSPRIVPPYSHAAGYAACDRTDLVACSDVRLEMMAAFGERYDVPKERHYSDYREMIEKECPDLLSVATQPEQRAEIVVHAVENGVKAIYAEKAMAASLAECDRMVEAVERHGVAFNLGTNRRWNTGYDTMKDVIDSGELGDLKSLIVYNNGTLFNSASHTFDLLLRLNNDHPVAWVQAHLPDGNAALDGEILREDPSAEGIIQFQNGVMAYALLSGRGHEYEAVCEGGSITAYNDGLNWLFRRKVVIDPQGRRGMREDRFPDFERASSTLRLVEDLVRALDTGGPTRGGVRVARASTEMIFAFVESHRRGGARVALPLQDCRLQLQRNKPPRQPKLTV